MNHLHIKPKRQSALKTYGFTPLFSPAVALLREVSKFTHRWGIMGKGLCIPLEIPRESLETPRATSPSKSPR